MRGLSDTPPPSPGFRLNARFSCPERCGCVQLRFSLMRKEPAHKFIQLAGQPPRLPVENRNSGQDKKPLMLVASRPGLVCVQNVHPVHDSFAGRATDSTAKPEKERTAKGGRPPRTTSGSPLNRNFTVSPPHRRVNGKVNDTARAGRSSGRGADRETPPGLSKGSPWCPRRWPSARALREF